MNLTKNNFRDFKFYSKHRILRKIVCISFLYCNKIEKILTAGTRQCIKTSLVSQSVRERRHLRNKTSQQTILDRLRNFLRYIMPSMRNKTSRQQCCCSHAPLSGLERIRIHPLGSLQ